MKESSPSFPTFKVAFQETLWLLVLGIGLALVLNDCTWGILLALGLGIADFFTFLRDGN